jgi:hypothetical protein
MKETTVADRKKIIDEMLAEMKSACYFMLEETDKPAPPIIIVLGSTAVIESYYADQDRPEETHFQGALQAMKLMESRVEMVDTIPKEDSVSPEI